MGIAKMFDKPIDENAFEKLKILIADDQSQSAKLEAVFLKNSGFHVKVSNTIDNMNHILNMEMIDIVIMNYYFTSNKGISEIKNAKSKSLNDKVKFIVIHNKNLEDINEKSDVNHCDLYLVKPIPRPVLIQEIKKLAKFKYRISKRVSCNITFKVTKGQEAIEAIATDISAEGAYLQDSRKKIKPTIGLDLSLEFNLPNKLKLIKCQATVVRITNDGFGIKFKNISEQDQAELRLTLKVD